MRGVYVCVCQCACMRVQAGEEEGAGEGLVADCGAQRTKDCTDKYNANRILHHVVKRSLEPQSGKTTVGTELWQ